MGVGVGISLRGAGCAGWAATSGTGWGGVVDGYLGGEGGAWGLRIVDGS